MRLQWIGMQEKSRTPKAADGARHSCTTFCEAQDMQAKSFTSAEAKHHVPFQLNGNRSLMNGHGKQSKQKCACGVSNQRMVDFMAENIY
jgi:hypothetical protein